MQDFAQSVASSAFDLYLKNQTAIQHALDPVKWIEDISGDYIWSKQKEICTSVLENRKTAVKACHGPGKSFIAARIAAWWIATHGTGDAFVVTTAPTWEQVNSILWREMQRAKSSANLAGEITLDAHWRINKELVAIGRKPADHNTVAFQGIHERYLLGIIDEASGVTEAMFDAVGNLATNENARILAIGNPDDPQSHFAKVCKRGSGWNTISISAFDTPAYTKEKVPDDLLDVLVSEIWVDEKRVDWGEESPRFISKVLGEFPDISDDTLISPAMIESGCVTEKVAKGAKIYAVDVARFGEDETVMYSFHNGHVRIEWSVRKQDTMAIANKIYRHWMDCLFGERLIIDEVGIGAGVVDRVREKGINAIGFNGGEKPVDDERFLNARAESWWNVREALQRDELDLDPLDDKLLAQLGAQKFMINSRGKIYLPPKTPPSPDRADALAMICWFSPRQSNMPAVTGGEFSWMSVEW